MRFSQRIGQKPIKTLLQVESMDEDLRNRLWNTIIENFFEKLNFGPGGFEKGNRVHVSKFIWKEFFNKPVDAIPINSMGTINLTWFGEVLRKWYFNAEWSEVYDLIEFLAYIDEETIKLGFAKVCNLALEKEVSGYRIVKDKVIQITSEVEINEIEEALGSANHWDSVNTHLITALDLLSARKSPDYRNSIKESISAVESMCVIITNDKKATLGKALSEIEKKYFIHTALKNSFSSLYGYTSDASGIRHALTEGEAIVGFEDAKLMLVSCSAFVNFLKAKMDK